MMSRNFSTQILCALAVAGVVHAQSFSEGFEPGPATPGTAAIPANWTSVNASVGGPGTNPNWQIRNDGLVFPASAGVSYAFANFNSSTGANNISNYLISPLVTLNNGDTISFYTRTVTAPTFPDRLELVFNTTGSVNPLDFTNVVLTINPTLTTAGYPTTWTQFTGTISGLSGPTGGRFAFHYNPTNGGPLGANSDYVGIDDVVYTATASGTLATNTNLGQGCYNRFNSFYEYFAIGTNDLSNTTWTMTANGAGGYDVIPGGTPFSAPSATATAVTLGDDNSAAVGTLGLVVGSNGWVATGAGNSTVYTPAVATMLANPAAAFYFWHDMNPTIVGSGQVFYEEVGQTAVITYNGVFDYGGTAPNSVRIEMIVTSPGVAPVIQIGFGALSTAGNEWLVGFSSAGASSDPGATDISAATFLTTSDPEASAMVLTANTRPVTGTNWNLATSNGALLDLIILGTADPAIPDLSFLGMPGCGLRATLDLISVGSTTSVAIPSNPALVGISLFANGASLSPGVNAFGAITSNGIQGTIGDV
ncbi:MAG: choice-of-anchor J domain-containing protein [Planctomycetes bacterium]|nr:choice-of-anchor J domain-containing protein [Planctomycetota bacterium]